MIQSGPKPVTWRAWLLGMRAMAALAIECRIIKDALQAAQLRLPWGLVLSVKVGL